ncbi:MAG: VanW family protein [Chloroflexi bacterium]|nr:VanW family protein [Chloroflexota bacterium]
MSAIPYPVSPGKSLLLGVLRAIVVGGVFFFLALLAGFAYFEWSYSGRIYPGVSVAGVDVSGLSPQAAAERLSGGLDFPERGRILLTDNSRTWSTSPAKLGFFADPESSVMAAYQIGRTGLPLQRLNSQLEAWFSGQSLPAIWVLDQRVAQRYLQAIAQQIDRPVVEASLGLQGFDVQVHSGQVGRSLDVNASLNDLSKQLQSLQDGVVTLTVKETAPVILDASQQAEVARRILSDKLTLTLPDAQSGDPGPWVFEPATLAGMLSIEKVKASTGEQYQVALNPEPLRAYLTGLAPSLQREAQNARFTFNDETDQLDILEHAVIGRTLDVEATIQSINDKLDQGEHSVPLVFKITPPAAGDDATTASLGIKELIHTETSYFYGSAASRVQNIKIAAARFHGLLVAPGETFSMAQALGDVSLDNGYAEALIILGNQTIKGVGGGVCQVSTTLFRAAFFSGFPIVERHAHAYRVYYYEKVAGNKINTKLAGLDATVYVPLVDLKFTNDSPYWLLMETYVNSSASSITWKFYSTSDGRTVDWQTTGPVNPVPPPPAVYHENTDLSKGTIKQVDWAAEGADVVVNRTVNRDGTVYFKDTFRTHYQAWPDMFDYGPGTEIPTPEPTAKP